jgi:hypothetical protein
MDQLHHSYTDSNTPEIEPNIQLLYNVSWQGKHKNILWNIVIPVDTINHNYYKVT